MIYRTILGLPLVYWRW